MKKKMSNNWDKLLENKEYEKLLKLIKNSNDDNFYDLIIYHLKALRGLNKIDEFFKLAEEELTQPYIPNDIKLSIEHLVELTQFEVLENEKVNNKICDEDIIELLESNDELMFPVLLINLANSNVRKFLPSIKKYLEGDANPIFKSMIFEVLVDQKIDEKVKLTKFGQEFNLIPQLYNHFMEDDDYIVLDTLLKNNLDSDPSLYKIAQNLLMSYFYLYFPLIEINDIMMEAAKIHIIAIKYLGHEKLDIEQIMNVYDEFMNINELERSIQELELILEQYS